MSRELELNDQKLRDVYDSEYVALRNLLFMDDAAATIQALRSATRATIMLILQERKDIERRLAMGDAPQVVKTEPPIDDAMRRDTTPVYDVDQVQELPEPPDPRFLLLRDALSDCLRIAGYVVPSETILQLHIQVVGDWHQTKPKQPISKELADLFDIGNLPKADQYPLPDPLAYKRLLKCQLVLTKIPHNMEVKGDDKFSVSGSPSRVEMYGTITFPIDDEQFKIITPLLTDKYD